MPRLLPGLAEAAEYHGPLVVLVAARVSAGHGEMEDVQYVADVFAVGELVRR